MKTKSRSSWPGPSGLAAVLAAARLLAANGLVSQAKLKEVRAIVKDDAEASMAAHEGHDDIMHLLNQVWRDACR